MELRPRLALLSLVVGWSCLTASATTAQEPALAPYRAYVARPGEYARCGPGAEFYMTDSLEAGEAVDVYLETADGWLGIRPPDASFCWVQSDQIQVAGDESIGIVTDGSAVAWIGTQLGRARKYRWQVRLQEGEEVTVIGTANRPGPDGDELWYRIVPPAGEFRWVHQSQVVESPGEVQRFDERSQRRQTGALASDVDGKRPVEAGARDTSDESRDREAIVRREDRNPREAKSPRENVTRDESAQSVLETDEPIGSGLVESEPRGSEGIDVLRSLLAAGRPDPPTAAPNAGELAEADVRVRSTEVLPASTFPRDAGGLTPTARPDLAPLHARGLDEVLQGARFKPSDHITTADVAELRTELSRAMAQRARAMEVEAVRQRAAQISIEATNSIERGRAAILLKRIEEYQLVASRRDAAQDRQVQPASATLPMGAGTNGDTAGAGQSEPAADRGVIVQTPGAQARSGEFDRQGWLVRVYSARAGAPPYAITDANGRTLAYVTPVPGMNLNRYLNQQVGLYGRHAQDTSRETPHLFAEQVVRLRR